MTLREFLEKLDSKPENKEQHVYNKVNAGLALKGISIDFDRDIETLTNEELYQIGSTFLFPFPPYKHHFEYEYIDRMKELIQEYK